MERLHFMGDRGTRERARDFASRAGWTTPCNKPRMGAVLREALRRGLASLEAEELAASITRREPASFEPEPEPEPGPESASTSPEPGRAFMRAAGIDTGGASRA